jgi:tRNA pseudouridine55 synthase
VFDDAVKEYVAVLRLHRSAPADLESTVGEFEGEIYQKPPRKSAVSRKLRTRTIHALDVLEVEDERALLRIECESGTYVRKLCHDIGLALGTGAHMGDLRRTRTGTFDDSDLVTLHDLSDALAYAEQGDENPICETVAPAERALTHLPKLTVAESAAEQIAEGAPVYAPGVIDAEASETGALVACYTPDGAAVCLGTRVGDPDAESGVVVDLERVLV